MRKDLGLQLQATKRREFDSLGIVLGLCYDSRWISQEDGDPPPVEAINYVPNARPGCLAPHTWLPDGRSLYDLFGLGFTLLVAQGANESEVQKRSAVRRVGKECGSRCRSRGPPSKLKKN